MRKNKYNEKVTVCWRNVLRCLNWALTVRRNEAERWIGYVEEDIRHSYPDDLERDVFQACCSCDHVFYHFEMFNTLRDFLHYKPKTVSQMGLEQIYSFYDQYKKESPDSACLVAYTDGGCSDCE